MRLFKVFLGVALSVPLMAGASCDGEKREEASTSSTRETSSAEEDQSFSEESYPEDLESMDSESPGEMDESYSIDSEEGDM